MQSMRVGDIEVTAISDGLLPMGSQCIIGLTGEETARRVGSPNPQTVTVSVNAFLIKRNGSYELVDAGSGHRFGPHLGRQPDNLRAIGVAPEAISRVYLTHCHPDHSEGLIDPDGAAIYPNAEVVLHEEEASFWLDRDLPPNASDMSKRNKLNTLRALAAYPDRIRRVKDGEVVPGVSAALQMGHTPGHTGWLVHSGSEGLLIWGDLVHLTAIQVAEPEAAVTFDIDPDKARASRRRVFDRVVADRLSVAGAHLDFPGFGTISRKGTGYQYEPAG